MSHDVIDPELERRLVAALHEQIPRLQPAAVGVGDPTASRGAWRRGDSTGATTHVRPGQPGRDHDPDGRVAPAPAPRRPPPAARARRAPRARHSPTRALGIAAAVGAVAGLGALLVFLPGNGNAPTGVADTAPPVPTGPPAPTGDSGSLLTTALPAGIVPRVVADGWTYAAYSGVQPLSADPPSTDCPGCGTDRLLLAADGALFAGPIVTAWTLDAVQDPADFDWPVRINGVDARFMGAIDGGVPAAENRVVVMLPLLGGRTGYVESSGLANDEVFALAASIDFSGAAPTVVPPAGMHLVDSPRRGDGQWTYASLDGPDRADGTGVWHTLEVYATNLGLQGLADWRYPTSRMLLESGWTPREVEGVTTAFDDATADPASAGNASAIWVSGDWAYVVIGHRFTSADDFDAALRSLRLTDGAGFEAAVTGALHASLATAEEEMAKASG